MTIPGWKDIHGSRVQMEAREEANRLINWLYQKGWRLNDYRKYLLKLNDWVAEIEPYPCEQPPLPIKNYKKLIRQWTAIYSSPLLVKKTEEIEYRTAFVTMFESFIERLASQISSL